MRRQQKTYVNPFLPILLIGIFGTACVAASLSGLTTVVKVDSSKVVGTAIENTKPPLLPPASPLPQRRLKKRQIRDNEKPSIAIKGYFCGKSFHSIYDIEEVTKQACPKIKQFANSKQSKSGEWLRGCAPNIPYCNYNYPHQLPQELNKYKEPLYYWPIVSKLQRFFGLKGSDRILISIVNNNCKYRDVMRMTWRNKIVYCVHDSKVKTSRSGRFAFGAKIIYNEYRHHKSHKSEKN